MSRFAGGRFSISRFGKGRFSGRPTGPYITLAIGQTLPSLLAVEAGDAYADALPPALFNPATWRVAGDETDEIAYAVVEISVNGAEYFSEYSPDTLTFYGEIMTLYGEEMRFP